VLQKLWAAQANLTVDHARIISFPHHKLAARSSHLAAFFTGTAPVTIIPHLKELHQRWHLIFAPSLFPFNLIRCL
jgi:hypothetical protein